jgi:hypothetical protein
MAVFGLIFLLAGLTHFLLAVVLRIPAWTGYWASNGVPVSRVGDTAWSLCIASWGLAMLLPPPALATPCLVVTCVASFPVLIAAGLYDQRRHRRASANRALRRPDPSAAPGSPPPQGEPAVRPLFPAGFAHFRNRQAVLWFVLLLLPVCASAAAALVRGRHPGEVFVILLLGVAAALILIVSLGSGTLSTRQGTYDRHSEPIRYWLHVGLFGLAYLGMTVIGWLI